MKIYVSAVNYSIPFAPPDPLDIRAKLAEAIRHTTQPSSDYLNKFGNADLDIIAVLDRNTKELEVKGPTFDSKLVEFGIWLPYKKMKGDQNYRLSYFNHFCEGIFIILNRYNFDTQETKIAIDNLQKELFDT
jgi:hypothetical protein